MKKGKSGASDRAAQNMKNTDLDFAQQGESKNDLTKGNGENKTQVNRIRAGESERTKKKQNRWEQTRNRPSK